MHHPPAAISRGDVLARGASLFVVHEVTSDGGLRLFRAVTPRGMIHRSDVRPEHWSDLADAGLPLQDLVIRCLVVARESASGFTRLGRVSRVLQERCTRAVARDCEARRIEATAPVRSTLDALRCAGSRGRMVGRQNAT